MQPEAHAEPKYVQECAHVEAKGDVPDGNSYLAEEYTGPWVCTDPLSDEVLEYNQVQEGLGFAGISRGEVFFPSESTLQPASCSN